MVRVRLRFDSTPLHYARQCWFLFDPDSCRVVGDVAYLIAKRFHLQDAHGIQLYMDDFLIPSNESAHILQDNDMVRVRTIEEAAIDYTDASSSPEKSNRVPPTKKAKLGHNKKREKEKQKTAITAKRTIPSPGTSNRQQLSESIGTGTANVGTSTSRRLREVTTQSQAGATHTKFCSSSDSEPDELPLSSVAAMAALTPTTTSPASRQQHPPSKNRKNRKTFPSVVGGPSDVHTTKSVTYQRVAETCQTQEQRLEDKVNGTGSDVEGTRREEFHEPPAAVLPVPESTKDYTALPDLHGAPRNGDRIAFKMLELSVPDYTPEVSEYKEAGVLEYDGSTKIVKLKLSEATLKKEMLKAGEAVKGRFTLMEEEAQEPIAECQDVVKLPLDSLMNPKLIPS